MKRTYLIVMLGIIILFSPNVFGQTPFVSGFDRQRLPQYEKSLDQFETSVPRKQTTLEEGCPKSQRLARLKALKDAAKFSRTHSLATKSTFLREFRKVYGDCPQFVKKAYQEAAQAILVPRKPERFKR